MKHYDIAIVGGGIVGRCLAATLRNTQATKRLKIALFDSIPTQTELKPRTTDFASISNRASSITHRNYSFIESLLDGGECAILREHSHEFKKMYIWEGDSTSSRIQLDSFTPMGRIVENNALIYTLQRRVEGEIDTFHGKVQATQGDDVMRLSLGDAQFTCSLLIGADGKESIVRKLIQPNIFGRNYNQKGLVATISTDAVKNDTAFQRFLPTGPFALLPIGEGALSMVWTLPSETVERILSLNLPKENLLLLFKAACRLLKSDVSYYLANPEVLSEEEYKWRESVLEDVHKDLNSPLPNLIDVSSTSLAAFPLSLSIAQKTVAERTIIIGDAAHVFHPLAGQGVDLGIADVRDLCDTISEAASVGADLGDVDSYKFYEKRRLASTMTMAGFCDATHRVFDPSFPVPKLRTLGMKCVEMSPLIKNFVMQAAQL